MSNCSKVKAQREHSPLVTQTEWQLRSQMYSDTASEIQNTRKYTSEYDSNTKKMHLNDNLWIFKKTFRET